LFWRSLALNISRQAPAYAILGADVFSTGAMGQLRPNFVASRSCSAILIMLVVWITDNCGPLRVGLAESGGGFFSTSTFRRPASMPARS
jgi:hypothetical protein